MSTLFESIELTGMRKAQVHTRKPGTESNHKSNHESRPLSPPTEQARQVFTKTLLNTPDADMRAVPNQWLLNQRGLSEKVAHDLESEIETLHAEITRLREALQSISGLYWTDAPCPQEMRDIAAAALKEKP